MGQRLRRVKLAVRKAFRRIVYAKDSPGSIAGGFALGIFVGLTPTMGFQMIPAAFLAALLGLNVVAAAAAVWITNPLTAAPIYYFEYCIGKVLLPFEAGTGASEGFARLAEKFSEVSLSDFWRTFTAAAVAFAELGWDVIIRFLLGSFVCASVGATATYPAAYFLVKYVRHRRSSRKLRQAEARLEELNAAGLVRPPQAPQAPTGAETGTKDSPKANIIALEPRPDDGSKRAEGKA